MSLPEDPCNKKRQQGKVNATFHKKQQKPRSIHEICYKHSQRTPTGLPKSSLMNAVCKGINLAQSECRHQFKWDVWGCRITENADIAKNSYIKGTREDSFLHAISSAAIVYEVYKSCQQDNHLCKCNFGSSSLDWKWSGCSDYVKYGENISVWALFKDDVTDIKDKAIKCHNVRIGHWAVKWALKKICKCHGVTGSCTTHTCWYQHYDFRHIGNLLKRKYKRSKCVSDCKRNNNNKESNLHANIAKLDFVYNKDSPNYCVRDNMTYMGILHRECTRLQPDEHDISLRTKSERNNCKRLCKECGHKLKSVKYEETVRCDCKFQWCCSVQCKHCKQNVTKYFCK